MVLLTLHVTVFVEPAGQLFPAPSKPVTANGPVVALTVTIMSVNCVCPTLTGAVELYGALSRTVNLNLSVLATELRYSILALAPVAPPGNAGVNNCPAKILSSLGKYRIGLVVGIQDIQLGPDALLALANEADPEVVALSSCSQQ